MIHAATMEFDSKRGFIERRTGNRHISVFRVGRLIYDGHDQLCVIRNISSGGVMIEANRIPPVGARAEVELRSDRRQTVTVRWARDREAGVAFDQPIDVAAVLREERTSILRHQPRAPRFVRTGLTRIMGMHEAAEGVITNISIIGLGIRTEAIFAREEPVTVVVDGLGAARAVVRWCEHGEVGLRLQLPLSYRALADWLDERADGSLDKPAHPPISD